MWQHRRHGFSQGPCVIRELFITRHLEVLITYLLTHPLIQLLSNKLPISLPVPIVLEYNIDGSNI